MPSDFPAPPYMRSVRPGKPNLRLAMKSPGVGRHQSNTSVAPLVHINGIGEKLVYADRAVITHIVTRRA